jgi:hypothetical protein
MNFALLTKTLPEHALREVTLRLAQPDELPAARAALDAEHCLGAPKPAECDVVQLALRGEQVLAVLVWTRGSQKLAARDAWIAWDPRTRARRVPLVVQNNRLLVLSRPRQPNLASRVLGPVAAAPWGHPAAGRDLRRSRALSRHLLQGGRLDRSGKNRRLWPAR